MQQESQELDDRRKFSASFADLLNAYALSASAAGVAILACSVPAEGEAVCVPLQNVSLTGSVTYQLYLPSQDIPAFNIAQTWTVTSHHTFGFWNRGFFTPNSAAASVVLATNGFPADLSAGAVVGSGDNFGKGNSYGLLFTYGPSGGGTRFHHQGNFSAKVNYVGFKFKEAGQTHFGWARMRITLTPGPWRFAKHTTIHINAYGFETTPNQAIQVDANCKNAGQPVENDSTPHSSAGEAGSGEPSGGPAVGASSDTVQTTLGALALGAQGVPLWRQK